MKGFWLIIMLLGLLVTGWLVLQDMQAKKEGAHGTANFQAVERADRAREAVDAATKAQERLLQNAGRE